jgi:hypothetical protein
MRAALLIFMLSIPLIQPSAQQQASGTTSAEESIPEKPIPRDSPCASQPRSLSELTASFNKGRAPSVQELKGTWVEIGNFNYGMLPIDDEIRQPHFRSLNCTGIMRGKKFEFAMIGKSYAYVMQLHVVDSSGTRRERMGQITRVVWRFPFAATETALVLLPPDSAWDTGMHRWPQRE